MMRTITTGIIAGIAAVVMLSALPAAQTTAPRSPWRYYPDEVKANVGPGGPAPIRDLTGTWAGGSAGAGLPPNKGMTPAPFTPLGKQLNDQMKPLAIYSPAGTNDPHVRYCDPVGFPRSTNDENRGMTFGTTTNRVLLLNMWQNTYREIWTDGRSLPTGMFGTSRDALDPTYNGYSVGRWVDDYTFAVDTTGMDPATWLSRGGYPHSVDAVVHERYHRESKNELTLTITMDDPKLYTATFGLGEMHFRWVPNQKLLDFTCIPSITQEEYLKEMGDPAGSDPEAARAGRGRGGRGN
jgi:hypothetical protein